MAWYSELARRILPRPTLTPVGDKPLASRSLRPRYIFSFRHRPPVYNSARFAGGEPASRLIGGDIFVRMTRPAGLTGATYFRTNDEWGAGLTKGCREWRMRGCRSGLSRIVVRDMLS